MATTKIKIGEIPIGRGEWNASVEYYKENTVTLYDMSFRAKQKVSKGVAPAVIGSDGKVALRNTDVWELMSGNPATYNTANDVEKLSHKVDNIKPIVINGNVTNAPDEEDITFDGNNLLKLKDRSAGNGMGYVILRTDKTFSEQVAQPNTIYEIRYDFDLDGAEVEIPSNCVLKFDGGAINNGTINCDKTHIQGEPIIHNIKGSVINTELKASWFKTVYANDILATCISSQCYFYADKDVAFSDATMDVNGSLLIKGEKCEFSNMPALRFYGDRVVFNDVVITCSKEVFLDIVGDARDITIQIDNIEFDGQDICERFIQRYADGSVVVKGHITIVQSYIHNVVQVGINYTDACENVYIERNRFEEIGSLTIAKGFQIAIRLGGDHASCMCINSHINQNVFRNIKTVYASADDAKETHAILVYGDNNTISGNDVNGIYSNAEDEDPGTETEAIYVKGSYNVISHNIIQNADGYTNCDAAITLKGHVASGNYSNIIEGNTIYIKRGTGITDYGEETLIKDNSIHSVGYRSEFAIYLYDSHNTIIEGNVYFNSAEKNTDNRSAFVYVSGGDVVIQNNYIKCATMVNFGQNTRCIVKNNTMILEEVNFGTNSKHAAIFSGYVKYNVVLLYNSFYLTNVHGSSILSESGANMLNIGNYYEIKTDVNIGDIKTYCLCFVRGDETTTCESLDEVFNIGSNASIEGYLLHNNTKKVRILRPTMMGNNNLVFNTKQKLAQNMDYPSYGTTEERPVVGNMYAGYQYFDQSLSKPIYWTGSEWVDATGATV